MFVNRRPVAAALLCLSVLVAGTLGATEEEDGMGALTWSSTNNQRCVRTTHQCVEWSADNTPTNEVSYECGNLYYFHTTQKVLTACNS